MKTRFLIAKLISLVVLLFVAIATIPMPTFAAPSLQEEGSPLADQTWVRLGGPLGGIGYDIKMNPINPDIMYATDAFSGIHKSMDGGKTWFPINNGIDIRAGESRDSIPVFCVTIDPNNSDIIWIGLQNTGAIYKSTDAGNTWVKKISGIVESNGFTVRGISVEPGNSDIVYVAGELSSTLWSGQYKSFQGFDFVKGVVYKSINGGESWTPIWRGDNLARYILINPDNPNILYISTGIFDRYAANSDPANGVAGGTGIFKSVDGGGTWNPINNGLKNLYVGSLYISPVDSNTLLAGTGYAMSEDEGGGIYRSTDGGLTWQYVGGSPRVISVEISTSNPQIAYAADVAHSNFFRSDDGGATWIDLSGNGEEGWGPKDIFAGWPIDLQVDPRDPMRVFVNNYGGGNFLSEDGGGSWSVSSTGYTGARVYDLAISLDNPATVYATGSSGTFRSENGGIIWESLGEHFAGGQLIVSDPENSDVLFISRDSLMLFQKSIDRGKNWELVMDYEAQLLALQNLGTSTDQQGLAVLSYAPSNLNILYAGVIQSHCFKFGDNCGDVQTIFSVAKSTDRGSSWQPIYDAPFNGTSVTDIVVHPEQPEVVWVATVGMGVFKTSDGGLTWEKITPAGGMDIARSLQSNPAFPDHFLLGTDKGMYVSQDAGLSWKKSSSGMDPNERIWDIVFDPTRRNIVYAGSLASGIYLSEDFGQTWKQINTGLTNRNIYTLSISSDGKTLYAGTGGEGVFRLSTHDQAYFDSLAPTPTAIPPTITPTSPALETPVFTPTLVLSTTPSTAPISSTIPIYISAAIVLLIGSIAFALWRRKSRGG